MEATEELGDERLRRSLRKGQAMAFAALEQPDIVLRATPHPQADERLKGSEHRFETIDEARCAFKVDPNRRFLEAEIWVKGKRKWASMRDDLGKVCWKEIR
jgi:hypothetical protein